MDCDNGKKAIDAAGISGRLGLPAAGCIDVVAFDREEVPFFLLTELRQPALPAMYNRRRTMGRFWACDLPWRPDGQRLR